jgi:hypothetical protein
VNGRAPPLFNHAPAIDLRFYSLTIFLYSRILLPLLPCTRSTATTCVASSFEILLPPCRTGRGPTCPAICFAALSRPGSSLHSLPPWSGRCPGRSPCCTHPKGTSSRSWPFTSAASLSLPGGSSGGPLRVRPSAAAPQPE